MSGSELDLSTLVLKADLTSISYFELSARVVEGTDAEGPEDADEDSGESSASSQQYLSTARRDDDAAFRVRIRLELTTSRGEFVVDIAAEYELTDARASEISEDLMLEYVNHVAVMQLIPYMRQSISDLSQRVLGEAFLLPVLQRGQMEFYRTDPS